MGPLDGSVVPSAAAGSLPFMPEATLRVLRTIKARYPGAWSRYGFVNAFNASSESNTAFGFEANRGSLIRVGVNPTGDSLASSPELDTFSAPVMSIVIQQ